MEPQNTITWRHGFHHTFNSDKVDGTDVAKILTTKGTTNIPVSMPQQQQFYEESLIITQKTDRSPVSLEQCPNLSCINTQDSRNLFSTAHVPSCKLNTFCNPMLRTCVTITSGFKALSCSTSKSYKLFPCANDSETWRLTSSESVKIALARVSIGRCVMVPG